MNIINLSVFRPVFISMVILAGIVLGIMAYFRLGVDEFPEVSPPVVTITTRYLGAGPREIESLISRPLEEEVGQLGGIEKLTSVSREGISQVVVEFKLGLDVKMAQVEVRDRVSRARPQLPEGIEEPLIQRLDFADRPILQLGLIPTAQNISEARLWLTADQVLRPKLEQIEGVGQIDMFGGEEREVRVELDGAKLKLWKVTPAQVVDALRASNTTTPAGVVREGSQETAVRLMGEFTSVSEVQKTVVKTLPGNRPILVQDLGQVFDHLKERESLARVNGVQALLLEIKKQSDANTVKVADKIVESLPAINAQLPEGMKLEFIFDGAKRIKKTIADVIETLIIAGILAILVVYFFLGSVQSTLITGLALPMTLITTCIGLYLIDYTLNIMTLLGFTLAVGLILDDAIVVRENIWSKIEQGMKPQEASLVGTKEVLVAVLATSATILAVFFPITLIPGIVGRFFSAFAVTVCLGVVFSTFDALTMAPMMSAHMMSSHEGAHAKKNKVLMWLEGYGDKVSQFYRRTLVWSLGHKKQVLFASFGIFLLSLFMAKFIGFTFLPQTERGELEIVLEAPAGTSLQKTNTLVAEVERILKQFPEIQLVSARVGSELQEKNMGRAYVKLVPESQRDFSTNEMKNLLREKISPLAIREHLVFSIGDPGGGGGGQKQISIAIQGTDTDTLSALAQKVIKRSKVEIPSIADLDTSMRPGQNEIQIELDRAHLAQFGLTSTEVGRNLRALFEGEVATQFKEADTEFDLRVRLKEDERLGANSLAGLYLPNSRGEMVNLENLGELKRGVAPTKITRIGRSRAVLLEGNSKPGFPLNESLSKLRTIITEELPAGYHVDFQGQAKNMKDLAQGFFVAVGLSIIFIYMVMASLYESLILPFSILLTLPLAIVGAFAGLLLTGKFFDIYTIIGVILLLGLVTKNAILLVDYLEQLRRQGMGREEAIMEAGLRRLRPIMMTSISMIAGFIPVAMGLGEVNQERSGMGVVAIGGMISSTLLSLIVVPCAYIYLDNFRLWSQKKKGKIFGKNKEVSISH